MFTPTVPITTTKKTFPSFSRPQVNPFVFLQFWFPLGKLSQSFAPILQHLVDTLFSTVQKCFTTVFHFLTSFILRLPSPVCLLVYFYFSISFCSKFIFCFLISSSCLFLFIGFYSFKTFMKLRGVAYGLITLKHRFTDNK